MYFILSSPRDKNVIAHWHCTSATAQIKMNRRRLALLYETLNLAYSADGNSKDLYNSF